MNDNNLNEDRDKLLYGLIEDLNVIINTTLIPDMNMKYATAREESQGKQTVFNTVSDMQDNSDDEAILHNLRPPKLRRETSAYATPGRLNLIREISNNSEVNEINEVHIRVPSPVIISPFEEEN